MSGKNMGLMAKMDAEEMERLLSTSMGIICSIYVRLYVREMGSPVRHDAKIEEYAQVISKNFKAGVIRILESDDPVVKLAFAAYMADDADNPPGVSDPKH